MKPNSSIHSKIKKPDCGTIQHDRHNHELNICDPKKNMQWGMYDELPWNLPNVMLCKCGETNVRTYVQKEKKKWVDEKKNESRPFPPSTR